MSAAIARAARRAEAPRDLVPWVVAALVAATVGVGALLTELGHFLDTGMPPFTAHWRPAVSPWAVGGLATLIAGVPTAIALRTSRVGPVAFAIASLGLALALRLALSISRAGPEGWYDVFVVRPESGEGRHEYLPALPILRERGIEDFLGSYHELIATLPTHAAGHPPGLLLTLEGLGIDSPQGMAALTIVAGALAVPLLYLLGRALFDEGRARLAAILLAFSPATLLYGATSADALFASLGVAAAAALLAAKAPLRIIGGLLLAVSAFFSWALLGVGALSALLAQRLRGWRAAIGVAGLSGAVVVASFLALHLATGFDPPAILEANHDRYFAGLASRRPYEYWLFGSPAAFLVAAGLPISWYAARALGRSEPVAVALAIVVAVSALFGYTKAETERIWLFLVPFACLAAAALPPPRLQRVLVLLLVQAVGVELLLETIW